MSRWIDCSAIWLVRHIDCSAIWPWYLLPPLLAVGASTESRPHAPIAWNDGSLPGFLSPPRCVLAEEVRAHLHVYMAVHLARGVLFTHCRIIMHNLALPVLRSTLANHHPHIPRNAHCLLPSAGKQKKMKGGKEPSKHRKTSLFLSQMQLRKILIWMWMIVSCEVLWSNIGRASWREHSFPLPIHPCMPVDFNKVLLSNCVDPLRN